VRVVSPGERYGEGAVPKFFDYLIKWHILMHIWGIWHTHFKKILERLRGGPRWPPINYAHAYTSVITHGHHAIPSWTRCWRCRQTNSSVASCCRPLRLRPVLRSYNSPTCSQMLLTIYWDVLVYSKRELKFMFAICHRPSVCRLSVCLLSVGCL